MGTQLATRPVAVTDAAGRSLGVVAFDSDDAGQLGGTFTPGPDFPAVADVFRFYSDVVEQQSFAHLDRAEAAVAAVGVAIRLPGDAAPTPVRDVQLYTDGEFYCRLPAGRNGAH